MATPVGLGITTHSQHLGIIRSLTDDFLRARAAARRSRDQSEVSDSEDVRWVSEEREREREREGERGRERGRERGKEGDKECGIRERECC